MILPWLETLFTPLIGLGIILQFAFSRRWRALTTLPQEMSERLGMIPEQALLRLRKRPVVWIHAASAGEVGAAAGLILHIKTLTPQPVIVVTTTTAAGRFAARTLPSVNHAQFAPIDAIPVVDHFLNVINPYALIIVETELWPAMITRAAKRGVRVVVANGRITERSFKRYKLLKPLLKPCLRFIERAAAQTEYDAERFWRLGIPPLGIAVTGNMKYDLGKPVVDTATLTAFLKTLDWEGYPVFVAGSTHPQEESAVLDAFKSAQRVQPKLKLVLAPRHIERTAEVSALLDARGLAWTSWSRGAEPGVTVLLLDTLGVLNSFYARATVAFVGGTLVPVGGHNLLEPALAGVPMLFGPHTSHVSGEALLLENTGGGMRVADAAMLAELLCGVLADPLRAGAQGARARAAAETLTGATERTWEHLKDILTPPVTQ